MKGIPNQSAAGLPAYVSRTGDIRILFVEDDKYYRDALGAALSEHGFAVREPRKTRHGVLYGVGTVRFGVCSHNRGGKQVKRCYVDDFISAMIELGLYEE